MMIELDRGWAHLIFPYRVCMGTSRFFLSMQIRWHTQWSPLYIFCVYFTWRWPLIGAETCKLVHNKIEHRNIVAYGGFKNNISGYTRNRMQNPTIKSVSCWIFQSLLHHTRFNHLTLPSIIVAQVCCACTIQNTTGRTANTSAHICQPIYKLVVPV
jgi:hypothetical protein